VIEKTNLITAVWSLQRM